MSERVLASVEQIDAIIPIPDADKICQYQIGGWKVVDQVGKYGVGDLIVYCSIDSWVPTEIAPFLSKGNEPKEYNGIKGERLRTIRLRKALSQGLLLPLSVLGGPEETFAITSDSIGADVTQQLGIQKWEVAIPAQLRGLIKGNFPSRIPKTDQERIQNLKRELAEWQAADKLWVVEEKYDGSSMTIYYMDGEFGVCSRNLDLKKDEVNTFWKVAIDNNLEEKLTNYCVANNCNLAIQGELLGEGVQGNRYKLQRHNVFVFDVFDIDKQMYYNCHARKQLVETLGMKAVHTIEVRSLVGDTMDSLIERADGQSFLNSGTIREGLVYKSVDDPSVSFKTISNKFLEKFE